MAKHKTHYRSPDAVRRKRRRQRQRKALNRTIARLRTAISRKHAWEIVAHEYRFPQGWFRSRGKKLPARVSWHSGLKFASAWGVPEVVLIDLDQRFPPKRFVVASPNLKKELKRLGWHVNASEKLGTRRGIWTLARAPVWMSNRCASKEFHWALAKWGLAENPSPLPTPKKEGHRLFDDPW